MTYLAESSSSVDVFLDAVENGAVVFQEVTVGLAAAALQSIGLAGGSCQGVEADGLGVRVSHVEGFCGAEPPGLDERRSVPDRRA